MNHRQQIRAVKNEIGLCLSALRHAKQYPDNYSDWARARYRNRLRQAVTAIAHLRRSYPDLFNARVYQTKLNLSPSIKGASL
jgi:hypothetical protein